MSQCTSNCRHIAAGYGWPHETMLEEDAGLIHTDDCGFMTCTHDHDAGECCTAGKSGVLCRVGLGAQRVNDELLAAAKVALLECEGLNKHFYRDSPWGWVEHLRDVIAKIEAGSK